MNLNSITVKALEETLKAWKSYQEPPATLLNLALLGSSNSDSLAEREILLRNCLEKIGIETLSRLRKYQNLPSPADAPHSPNEVLQGLKSDFGPGNPELEAWSAAYHLYLVSPEFNLSVGDLAEAAASAIAPNAQDKGQFRRRVREGLRRLVTALQQAEFEAHQSPRELPLPTPDYHTLFGVDEIVNQVADWLKLPEENAPLLISIEALGGWGKTAIARAVADKLLKSAAFADMVWISARHEELTDMGKIHQFQDPARSTDDIITRLAEKFTPMHSAGQPREHKIEGLKSILAERPYLIVIDNLETLNDIEDLLPSIFPLAGKTRFLLTSRFPLGKFAYVQCIHVQELSPINSSRLILSELQRRGRKIIPSKADTDKIYDVIGGVPLALKLVTSQMEYMPLTHILEGLREARQNAPEAMYTYIYRRTWQALLDEPAHLLLISLHHIPAEGEDEQWIYENSQLSRSEFDSALQQLLDASVLEITGSVNNPLYHLHRLTITFLRTEILFGWQQE